MYINVPMSVVLIVAGSQIPVMPLADAAGNRGGTEFWQSGPIAVNTGIISVAIVMFNIAGMAHCPVSGVKIYGAVPAVAVLITAGNQLPVRSLAETSGRAGGVLLMQSGPTTANNGRISAVTSIAREVVMAHCPSEGVNT